MILTNDEKTVFDLLVKDTDQGKAGKVCTLVDITQDLNLSQEEFVAAISSLRSNGLIKSDGNLICAELTEKGIRNMGLIKLKKE